MIEHAFFGPKARFHHVGLAVESIKEVNPEADVFEETTQKVYISFMKFNGVTMELLQPLGESSPIAKNLKDGVKLLHLCFEVPNLDEALELSRQAGFHRISRAVPAPIFGNRRIVWVYSKQYGLFELAEADRTETTLREEADEPAILEFQ